ncbi:MAG: DUF3618 domain-containing protein [Propionibacterium sp.]|nr:DUF3618 domain-containing protein [Propionibacterium sp.]
MTNDPDDIRADIERTRADLGRDVDALAEKVSPGKAVGRQTDKIRSSLTSAKESVFGSPDDEYGSQHSVVDDARERAGDMAHQASQAVQDAPAALRRRTRGNPLAAGLIALGAGWLIASLIPASQAEQDAARAVKDQAEPVVEDAKAVAQEMGEHLRPEAEQAVEHVKDTASEGVEHVKDEGQHHAEELQDESRRAAERVQDEARNDRSTP